MPCRVLAVAAHPDDIEFTMSGTLILLKRAGWELHYMNVANGSCGTMSDDTEVIAAKRLTEAKESCRLIGAHHHDPLTNDIEIFYEKELLARLASVVRDIAPDMMLVPSPEDYMQDHVNTCRLAVSAAFCRSMRNFPVTPEQPPVTSKVALYHAQPYGNRDGLGRFVRPDLFVNVKSVMEQRVLMLACHKSQKEWLDASQGLDAYLKTLRAQAREMGAMSGRFEFAEGWRRHNHLGLCDKDDDPLCETLKDLIHVAQVMR